MTHQINFSTLSCLHRCLVLSGVLIGAALLAGCGGGNGGNNPSTPSLPAPSLDDAPAQTYTLGATIPNLRFTNNGGESLTACAIRSNLPDGLSVITSSDRSTCEITGTVATSNVPNSYTITVIAINATGVDEATVEITIIVSNPALADAEMQSYIMGMAITDLSFTNNGGGSLTDCTDDPSLPSGLTVAVSSDESTCQITGTPTAVNPATDYTITATNTTGQDQAVVNIAVNPPPPSLAQIGDQTYTVNVAISDLIITNTGSTALTGCSAEPDLPTGLTVAASPNESDCVLTGTPTALNPAANYLITATNANGTGAVSINITVATIASSIFLPDSVSATNTTARLSWTEKTNALYYEIWRAPVGDGQIISRVRSNVMTTTYTDNTLISDTEYYYLIAECTPLGCADPSNSGPQAIASIQDEELRGANNVTTVTIDDRIYALITAETDNGVQIIDITDPNNLTSVASLNDTLTTVLAEVDGITTIKIGNGAYALVASVADNGIQIIDISNPATPTPISSIVHGDITFLEGAVDIVTTTIGTSIYAVVAAELSDAVQVIDITDPFSPRPVGSIRDSARNVLLNASGIATIDNDDTPYVLVSSFGEAGIQIIDLSVPGSPRGVGTLTDDTQTLLIESIDIAVAAIGEGFYAFVASEGEEGVQIIDISDPARPDAVESLVDTSQDPLTGIIRITTTVIGSNTYLLATTGTSNVVQIIDVGNPASPAIVGSFTGGISGNAGNLRGITTTVIGDSTYALVVDFSNHGVQLIDISDPASPTAAGSLYANDLNLLDGASAVTTIVDGDNSYALVTASNDDGVQIFDISNPSMPVAVGSLSDDASAELDGARDIAIATIEGVNYAVVAAASDNGIQIINISDPTNPTAAGSLTDNGQTLLAGARGIATITLGDSNYALVSARTDNGVQIINISDPANPAATGSLPDGVSAELDGANDIATATIGEGLYALVTTSSPGGVQIIDISDPADPTAAGSLIDDDQTVLAGARGIATVAIGDGAYALVAAIEDDGVQIIDISNPDMPIATASLLNNFQTELNGAFGITTATIGGRIYAFVVAGVDDGFQIIDISDPTTPVAIASITDTAQTSLGGVNGITTTTIDGKVYAIVAAFSDDGIQIIDISTPQRILPASSAP